MFSLRLDFVIVSRSSAIAETLRSAKNWLLFHSCWFFSLQYFLLSFTDIKSVSYFLNLRKFYLCSWFTQRGKVHSSLPTIFGTFWCIRFSDRRDIDLPAIDCSSDRCISIFSILLLSCQTSMLTVDYFESSMINSLLMWSRALAV